jgi:hypothetical protein
VVTNTLAFCSRKIAIQWLFLEETQLMRLASVDIKNLMFSHIAGQPFLPKQKSNSLDFTFPLFQHRHHIANFP